jgi:[ribosomal protein S5]-alanine N-acetyltransferase
MEKKGIFPFYRMVNIEIISCFLGVADMFIETERLKIRKFEFNDWKAIFEYTSNPDVMKYIPEGVFTEADAKDFVKKNIGEKAEKFPVLLKEDLTLIGHIVFHRYFGEHTYEIGWVFHPSYYNHGFASEAAKAVLKYAFEELKLHRIIATCQPENIGSYRVMEKIGMRREGYFKKCIPDGDGWWDEYYYAILEEEWEDVKK